MNFAKINSNSSGLQTRELGMRIVLLVAACVVLAACQSSGSSSAPPEIDPSFFETESEVYRIGVGDLLTVNVWGNPDLSLQVPVRPDGFITLPLTGDIHAADLDAEGLAQEITTLLSQHVRNPQVAVIVSQVNSTEYMSRVRVTGAVQTPRSIPYARGMSVLDAVLEAGGVNEVASANRAKLYREIDGELVELDIYLDDILLRGQLSTNYPIRPGDVITVPERLF